MVSVLLWLFPESGLDKGQLWQKISTKFILLGILISSSFWCGKNYRSLKHLSVINKHRSMSIQTLQAFVAAAKDVNIKDAVVLEGARSIFGNVPTGYIDTKVASSDGDIKLFEIAKSVISK